MPRAKQQRIIDSLGLEAVASLDSNWGFWLRANQLPPPRSIGHTVWLPMAGRGWGKTLTGAYATQMVAASGKCERMYLVGADAGDVRDVMIEGASGLMKVAPNHFRPKWIPSRREVEWPNGTIAKTYSAVDPESLRGPAAEFAWCDEIAKWRYGVDAWDQMMMGMREGKDPWICATTTPKPTKLVKRLVATSDTLITRGTTYDNMVNLAKPFRMMIKQYEGTALGEQELMGKLMDEAKGALWTLRQLKATRVSNRQHLPHMVSIVVAIDPAVTANDEGSDETGIVVVGLGADGHGYVLEDASGVYAPDEWADRAKECFYRHRADLIVAERNNGGDLVERNIRTAEFQGEHLPVALVWAKRGKHTRAQPVASLWAPKQSRAHMVGNFPELEEQLRTWVPGGDSPDRLDALVWGFTALFFPETCGNDLSGLPLAG